MNRDVVLEKLTAQPFEPFALVTNAGDRYEVRHSELAQIAPRHVYVFQRAGERRLVHDPAIIGHRNVSALKPLPSEAA